MSKQNFAIVFLLVLIAIVLVVMVGLMLADRQERQSNTQDTTLGIAYATQTGAVQTILDSQTLFAGNQNSTSTVNAQGTALKDFDNSLITTKNAVLQATYTVLMRMGTDVFGRRIATQTAEKATFNAEFDTEIAELHITLTAEGPK